MRPLTCYSIFGLSIASSVSRSNIADIVGRIVGEAIVGIIRRS